MYQPSFKTFKIENGKQTYLHFPQYDFPWTISFSPLDSDLDSDLNSALDSDLDSGGDSVSNVRCGPGWIPQLGGVSTGEEPRSVSLLRNQTTKQIQAEETRSVFSFFWFLITNRPGLLEAKVTWSQTCKSVECSTNQFSQLTNTRYWPNVFNRWERTRQWAKNKHLGYSRDATRWQRKSFL